MLFCGLSRQIMLGEIYSLAFRYGFLNVAMLLDGFEMNLQIGLGMVYVG
mgnify:CR=1 FL=1